MRNLSFPDELVGAYARAWEQIRAELESIADNPRLWRHRERLVHLEREVERLMGELDLQAYDWVQHQFPEAYKAGMSASVEQSARAIAFSQVHKDAVFALQNQLYNGLLAATSHTSVTTKKLVRSLARDQVFTKLLTGQTAKQAGREMRDKLEANKVHAIVYSNGARHNLADYSEMLLRTQTGIAYNQGALNAGREIGVEWFEIFDGIGCGWSSHQDSTPANGRIVRWNEVILLAHPRCQRAIGARPDLTAGSKKATPVPVQRITRGDGRERRAARREQRIARRVGP